MSVLKTPPTYDSRSVQEWLAMADRGDVLLPNFQRSFVWKPQQTAAYLEALLENRPTGIFLILEATDPMQFESRFLHGTDPRVSASRTQELVLDGQQRLTSLWGALGGTPDRRYLIRVKDLEQSDLEVAEVAWRRPTWSNPAKMYQENWIPVDILWNDRTSSVSSDTGLPASDSIKTWCQRAAGDDKWDSLYTAVLKIRERLVVQPNLQFCLLRKDTDADTAISIFINVNRSAIKLKEVEIAVALARANHGEDLRARVEAYLDRSTEVRHYFSPDPPKAITEVAEWMLKVGCLKVSNERHPDGLPPKASHYPSAVRTLLGSDSEDPKRRATERESRMHQLEADLDTALRFVARRGGATKRTLPSWPPVHVIAALQDDVRVAGPGVEDEVARLLSAYMWRAFLTERYGRQANDRLLEDFQGLRKYLVALARRDISGGDQLSQVVPAFNEKEHPLRKPAQIERAGWIASSRLGRAIAAVTMQGKPFDWATGERLDLDRVRELEDSGKLERRYIFPPALFKSKVGETIKLGLNGVLLARGPKSFTTLDPDELLGWFLENQLDVDELELRSRLGSHLVPFLALAKDGVAPGYRYKQFIKERAAEMALKMKKLASF